MRLFPKSTFDQMAMAGPEELMPAQERADLEADFFSLAETLEMDTAGRVLLPKLHLEMTGMPADVVVIGVRNRLEIRGAEAWKAGLKDRFARMPALAERVRNGGNSPEA